MRVQRASKLMALAVVLTLPLFGGCGGDDGTSPNNNNDNTATIVGSWVATSLTAPTQPQWGDAITGDGLSFSATFNSSGGYSISVSGDDPADPWICAGTASCSYSGTYSASGNTIVFDEGTVDELSATYGFSGGRLTLTFVATADITDPYKVVLERA